MQELIAKMTETMAAIQADLNKVDNKATLELEKLGKEFRKQSIAELK